MKFLNAFVRTESLCVLLFCLTVSGGMNVGRSCLCGRGECALTFSNFKEWKRVGCVSYALNSVFSSAMRPFQGGGKVFYVLMNC